MSPTRFLTAACMVATLAIAGCAKEKQDPIDRAVDSTKDALDIRENEKLKDAGENASDAVRDAKQGVKDAVEGKN